LTQLISCRDFTLLVDVDLHTGDISRTEA
jgi:hypothetical protein